MSDAPGKSGAARERASGGAPDRILSAAASCVIESGLADLSMQDVASAAGVSKGLIHYHFRDKSQLVSKLVSWLGARIVERQRRAVVSLAPAGAIDAVWKWTAGELERGELRALAALSLESADDVRAAARDSLSWRRDAAAEMVSAVFEALELSPRVPAALLGEVFVAFLDGLATDAPASAPDAQRVAFDVFWLALLTLGE